MTHEMRKLMEAVDKDDPGTLDMFGEPEEYRPSQDPELQDKIFAKKEAAAFNEVATIISNASSGVKDPLYLIDAIASDIKLSWHKANKSQFLKDRESDAGEGIIEACEIIEDAIKQLYQSMGHDELDGLDRFNEIIRKGK